MRHRHHTPRTRTAAAKRRPNALPYLLFALFLLLISEQANAQGYGRGGEVRLDRKRWAYDEIPTTLPTPVRDAVADWGPWTEEHGYNLLLDETRQVFLVTERRDRTAAKQLRIVDEALEVIEELVLAKNTVASPETPEKQMQDEPQDIEEYWGRAAGFDHDRVPVIALVHDQKTLDSVLHYWMALRPELNWQRQARQNLVSFISEEPLLAVIVTRDTSREEWDIEHETAALLTRLMLKRAHGPLPKWIEAGLTWQVETRLFKSVWHFFDRRSRLILSSSHSGWYRELRSSVCRRKAGAGIFDQAAEFNPREWNNHGAYLSWGLMGFVTDELGDRFPQYLQRLSELRDEGARVEQTNGTWIYDTTFLPACSDQFSALADLLGDDFEERSLKVFKNGLKKSGEPR